MRFLIVFGFFISLAFAQYYDVIVIGSEPEGIAAATAAAESGSRTLLVTSDPKLGGLFVMGQMNSLDLRTDPFNYQQGLFLKWWEQVGKGHSFDTIEAERAFTTMLSRAGVEVRLGVRDIKPILEGFSVKGLQADGQTILANQLIDATADMDFAPGRCSLQFWFFWYWL
jgi:flavin-dependent dehydrogenase